MRTDDVLILGAGPSGLFVAAELARHGITARLVERDLELHRQARATAIQPGTLEILLSVGLVPPILEASSQVHASRMYGPDMQVLGGMSFAGVDCCCEYQCSLPQYTTQRILENHLASLGGRIERGVTATKVEVNGDHATVELTHHDGRVEVARARVVIGAGGARCVTRQSMEQTLDGSTYRGHFLVADVAMDAPIPRTEGGVICSPSGFLLLAPLPGGRWISFQDLEEHVQSIGPNDVLDRIAARLGGRFRPRDVIWFSPFRMHRRIVSRMAAERRFLIGDAAHLSSPFGGEGLNAGLQDGHDLAWKLALVLQGHAGDAILAGYAVERQLADEHILDVSDQIHESIMQAVEATRRGETMQSSKVDPVALVMARNARTMVDVDYSGSPLVVDHAPYLDGPRPGQWYPSWALFGGTLHRVLLFGDILAPEDLHRIAQRWSKLLAVTQLPMSDARRAGVPAGGVVLVRPDGHIGFRIDTSDADAFDRLDRHLGSYLTPEPQLCCL